MKIKRLLLLRKFIMYSFYGILSQVLLCSALLAAGTTNGQKVESVKTTNATVYFDNDNLTSAFDKLEKSSGYTFVFDRKNIDREIKLNGNYKRESLYDILLDISKTASLKFKQVNNNITVKKIVEKEGDLPETKLIEIIQDIDISGKITDENNQGLPGASVVVKGTAIGTTTDLDGNYKLTITDGVTITISYVGYVTQDVVVGNEAIIDFKMQLDASQLQEIVVTALGIEKDAKALGYAVTQLDGKGFTEAREINLGNALTGKVAGVNVSNIASGPGGSTRVVIRGNSSISGNNQPLYVVDGVPMDNTTLGSAGQWGGKDWGDGLSSINPDDIESMTVLKGNSAGALYGSRASNGVILITTKKGNNRKGIGIELNSNFTFDKVIDTYDDLQTEYGQGRLGLKPNTTEEALSYGKNTWGAKLDGSPAFQFDGIERPYSYVGNNINNFYTTGRTLSNTVSLTAGDDTKNIRLSISDMDNTSVIPNSGMDRNTFMLSANGKFAKKLTLTTKIQYNIENVKNRPSLSDSPGNTNYSVATMPTNVDVRTLKGSTSKIGANADGTELGQNNNAFVNNPYWTAYQYETRDKRDRLIASGQLRYDFTDWLYLQGRVGTDWYTSRRRDLVPYGTNGSNGRLVESEIRQRETNAEFIIGMDKTFGDFRINSFFGGNRMRKSNERFDLSGSDFQVPFFHSTKNFPFLQSNLDQGEVGINSLFGSAEVSYKNVLFLTMTGRNDWFSTLEPETNSVFYPSTSLSFAFSDLIMELPSWFTFGKVRTAWSEVGGAPLTLYRTNLTYGIVGGHQGAALGSISSSEVPNRALRPLKVSEIEIGMDLRFFNDRLGLDIAYYDRKTTNDILSATISEGTGFSSAAVNIGEMTNKGVEFLLRGTPVKGPFTWNISFNYANNTNEVVKLADGLDVLVADQSRTRRAWIQHIVGEPFSSIVGYRQQRIDGQLVFGEFGGPFPKRDDETSVLGKGVAPTTGGISNDFYYKNFNLSFLLGFQMGGSIHSGTNTLFYTNGLHKGTLAGREDGLSFSALNTEGISEDFVVTPEELEDYYWVQSNYITEYVVYSSDYVKLRSFVLGYTLPSKLIEKTPFNSVNISFVGRNLWLIHSKTDNIDPESTYNNGNSQGLEYAAVPQSRSFGFNLSIKF